MVEEAAEDLLLTGTTAEEEEEEEVEVEVEVAVAEEAIVNLLRITPLPLEVPRHRATAITGGGLRLLHATDTTAAAAAAAAVAHLHPPAGTPSHPALPRTITTTATALRTRTPREASVVHHHQPVHPHTRLIQLTRRIFRLKKKTDLYDRAVYTARSLLMRNET